MPASIYEQPDPDRRTDAFTVRVDGEPIPVSGYALASVARFAFTGEVEVEIVPRADFESVTVRPLERELDATVTGSRLQCTLTEPATLSVEFDDDLRDPLFLFADRPLDRPDPADPDVRYFAGGQVHEPGRIDLDDGETLFVEGGGVVRGRVRAREAEDVAIRGHGVIDGTALGADGPAVSQEAGDDPADEDDVSDDYQDDKMVAFYGCEDVTIEGATVMNRHDPDGWSVVTVGCDDVTMEGMKVLGWSANDDGIDVVGSQRVRVRNCFVRTLDDCVAVKATDKIDPRGEFGCRDVRDVEVSSSVFWNSHWGNALEIGYETRADEITDVRFRDCDVIHALREGWSSGGVLTIHDGDRAHVHDVTYEDIRVEDAREKLVDFKIQHSKYSVDDERGEIDDVRIADVAVVDGRLPPSVVQGYDWDRPVGDVSVENLRAFGERLTDPLEARFVVELTDDVRFLTTE